MAGIGEPGARDNIDMRSETVSMNETPSGQRTHIGFFGCRNAGKSSLVNAVTGQELAVVSDVRGTTTDPVMKAMELLPLGPVVIIDTPGFDDAGTLGDLRVKRTRKVLNRCDLAVLVLDAAAGMRPEDAQLAALMEARGLPHLVAWNKCDIAAPPAQAARDSIAVSAATGEGVSELKQRLARLVSALAAPRGMLEGLIRAGDCVALVCPIDESAPKGRIILPQQQAIREILDAGAVAVVARDAELGRALSRMGEPPAMVVTDSQAFRAADAVVPQSVPLTSFSILLARSKGFLAAAVAGVAAIDRLDDGDRVLMAEGCTHHRQCNDIGTVKIPAWLRKHTGKDIAIETCSGRDFPEDLTPYRLVIHCGGCMLTERDVQVRMRSAAGQGVPFTNYGIAIARMTGILERSLRPFPELHALVAEEGP